jgi:hypothetical protein
MLWRKTFYLKIAFFLPTLCPIYANLDALPTATPQRRYFVRLVNENTVLTEILIDAAQSLFFSPQNAMDFIMLSSSVHKMFTFNIKMC